MPSHPVDFQLQTNFYVTPELQAIFDEQRKMNRWLGVEAALARAQGELGIIPVEAADAINARADMEQLDLEDIREGYQKSRNSLMPVIKALRKACGAEHGQFVHYGATTQDILDTTQVLELEETLQIVYRDLRAIEDLLVSVARKYRDTPMIGRTHGQQALPITLGLKTATWAVEIRRHIERIKSIYPRVTVGQLSGAVGTMAALGPQGREVAKRTMELLNLQWNPPSWHTSRDNIAELASHFALLAGTLEKIANEIFLLGKTEVGELAEPAPDTPMSSTMPHKRNPVLCQRVVALARHIRSLCTVVVESMPHEHERDPRLLWAEWLAMPQLSMYTGTAVHFVARILDGLIILEQNMKRNLFLHRDMVMSEWLLFRLAPVMGKMEAQEKLHELLRRAGKENSGLKEILMQDQTVGPLLNEGDMEMLDNPDRYTGLAAQLVDDSLSHIATCRKNDAEALAR